MRNLAYLLKRPIIVTTILSASCAAFAGDCGVTIDCKSHTIKVQTGMTSGSGTTQTGKVDCGKDSDPADWTYNSYAGNPGTIGSGMNLDYATSDNKSDGKSGHQIDINGIAGMGSCGAVGGGAKVIHVRLNNQDPAGADSTLGCIHIPANLMSTVEGCQGSSLTITGAHDPPAGSTACNASGSASSPATPASATSGTSAPKSASSTTTPATAAAPTTPGSDAVACGFQTINGVRRIVYCPNVKATYQPSAQGGASTIGNATK